ncbi:MAG: nucleotidyltransferase domain-containing protein [Candidatus Coatesbacteria bacterium]|nr:nucleotidyltransferase domain-containing protein [Candidatus Coatesbacteria bacterium]
MVDEAIVTVVRRYLVALPEYGIHATRAVLFGSFALGKADEWSDIDLIVLAPEFDAPHGIELVEQL